MAELYDDAQDTYVPDASDRDTRTALVEAWWALEDYVNEGDHRDLEAAQEFLTAASDGVLADMGVV